MIKKNYFLKVTERIAFCLIVAALFTPSFMYAQDLNAGLKLHYTFETATGKNVADVSGNGYDGTLYGATVGPSNGKNSLILGTSGTDYLDMGANTGNLISTLTDFSMSCYVWVNSTNLILGNNGNMIASFSNSLDTGTDMNGVMFLTAKGSQYVVSSTYYTNAIYCGTGTNPALGKWVQMTYTQSGTTGKFYQDGILKFTNEQVTVTPSNLGATQYNMLAKGSYKDDSFFQDAQISDFRIYNRAVTPVEVLMLNGYSSDFISAYNSLTISGDLLEVTGNLSLPQTVGTSNIPVVWTSNLPLVVSTAGVVTRPDKYDAPVILTATISDMVNGVSTSISKVFNIIVKSTNSGNDPLVAQWDFATDSISIVNGVVKVKDESQSGLGLEATVMNDARIRTIGSTTKYNVLDLGKGTGYLDMGTEIGKAVYSLTNYSMCAYYRTENSYTGFGSNGNFIWTFSNTDNVDTTPTGYVFGSLKMQGQNVALTNWNGAQELAAWGTPLTGSWHHFAYVQKADSGFVYIDGVAVKKGIMTNKPSSIAQAGKDGTLFNWLGRSPYTNDVYLRQTLLYDFRLLTVPLTSSDITDTGGYLEAADVINNLNAAYEQDSDYVDPVVKEEMDNFKLGDLSNVTSNLILPVKGTLHPTVNISWKSNVPDLISASGVVKRPNYYTNNVTLTATFSKGIQAISKNFTATVIMVDNTQITSDLIAKYDFTSVTDSVVTDASTNHFKGTLKNNAKVKTIGTSVKYTVLNLGDSIGYFDMGPEIGKVMSHLNDYTVGAFYRIDPTYTQLTSDGNFLWTLSNTKDVGVNPTGYLFGCLKDQSISITPTNWDGTKGEKHISIATAAAKGSWHHLGYKQSGNTGTIYIDGLPVMSSDTITATPSTTLLKDGFIGTLYNWIGRPAYVGNAYLRKTMVYDFRLYQNALTDDQILTSVLNIPATIIALNLASTETPNAVKSIMDSPFKVFSIVGGIKILGLTGNEKVSLFDISGRQLRVNNPISISANAGVYIVKINNYLSKVIVK